MKINASNISVVVQGAIHQAFTKDVLQSIRKYLPKAEIILSTWKESDTRGLDFDMLILSGDPGAEMLSPEYNQLHNLNRQIVSTKNGMEKATKEFVLKIRTDVKLTGNSFLNYFGKFVMRCDEYKFLRDRVLICQYYARLPSVFPFHIGDWVFFGYKEDLREIWDIPLPPEPETTNWFYYHSLLPEHLNPGPYSHFRHRYCAEQYIWATFLSKYIDFDFDHMFDKSPMNTRITEISFANNLVILSPEQFNIEFLKRGVVRHPCDFYTYNSWQTLYKKHCDKNHQIKIVQKADTESILLLYKSVKMSFAAAIKPVKAIYRWMRSCAAFIYKSLKLLLLTYGTTRSQEYYIYNNDETMYLKEILVSLKTKGCSTKNIVLFTLHLGEAYIFANIFPKLEEKYENPLFVTCHPAIKMLQQFMPENKVVYLKKNPRQMTENVYFIGNSTIHVLLPDDFWRTFQPKKQHFIDAAEDYLGIEILMEMFSKPVIGKDTRDNLVKKMKDCKLNIENFVVFFPEVNSMKQLPPAVWRNLANKFSQRGYDVFINYADKTRCHRIPETKSCFLTFEEMYLLAGMSRGIIALRSGVIEYLSGLTIQMHVIYSYYEMYCHFPNFFENYTLSRYPFVDLETLHEYKMFDLSDWEEIENQIIKKFVVVNDKPRERIYE